MASHCTVWMNHAFTKKDNKRIMQVLKCTYNCILHLTEKNNVKAKYAVSVTFELIYTILVVLWQTFLRFHKLLWVRRECLCISMHTVSKKVEQLACGFTGLGDSGCLQQINKCMLWDCVHTAHKATLPNTCIGIHSLSRTKTPWPNCSLVISKYCYSSYSVIGQYSNTVLGL